MTHKYLKESFMPHTHEIELQNDKIQIGIRTYRTITTTVTRLVHWLNSREQLDDSCCH